MCVTIKLNDYISCNKGIMPSEGEPIYAMIIAAFNSGSKVLLDFQNVDMMTTAFLNVVIGNLYKDYNSDQLKEKLSFANLTSSAAVRIKKVTDNAKLFYKDEKAFTQTVEEAINGNS